MSTPTFELVDLIVILTAVVLCVVGAAVSEEASTCKVLPNVVAVVKLIE